MPIDIKKLITDKNIEELKNVDMEKLISFKENGNNAFMYACFCEADYGVVDIILQRSMEYFSEKINSSEFTDKFKGLNISQDDEPDTIDIDKCGELGKTFFTFFYGTVMVNNLALNAAALALTKQQFETADLIGKITYLKPTHEDFLPTKTERESIFDSITEKHGTTPFGTYFSSKKIRERLPRSFQKEREKQLLKQLSTVLFFYIKSNGAIRLVETEILHLRINSVSHIIISCNGGDTIRDAFTDVANMGQLQNKLKNEIQVIRDNEGKERVKRYQKILKRIFLPEENGYTTDSDEDEEDIRKYSNVLKILKDQSIIIETVNSYSEETTTNDDGIKKILQSKKSLIFILNNEVTKQHKDYGRHAEEYLVDFYKKCLNYLETKNISNQVEISSCIAGKKRPCFTCYATMLNNFVGQHGKRPGFAWKSSLNAQKNCDPKITLLSILGHNSYVTKTKKGSLVSGYDTGSDDDEIKKEQCIYNIFAKKPKKGSNVMNHPI